MSRVAGKVCAVTGAGSGIGRELALELARRGARAVAVSDVDDAGLAETAALIAACRPAVTVSSCRLDVTDRAAVLDYAGRLVQELGVVHQLYNNAGIACGRTVLDAGFELYDRVLAVNLMGVINATKALLPHLIASGDGHVTTISSLNGYMAQDELSAYCTSKFAVRGFTEALRIEMLRDRQPVAVTVVHPGGVKTSIASNGLRITRELGYQVSDHERRVVQAYNDKLLRMSPQAAAKTILDGVERDRARVLVGGDARLVDLVVRLSPVGYQRLLLAAARLAKLAVR